MVSRAHTAIVTTSVMSVLILVPFSRQASTIILSNDVDISASNFSGFHDCVSTERNCKVVGAPRLIQPTASGFDIDQLEIKIERQGNVPMPAWVALNIFQYPSLRPAGGPNGPLRLLLMHPSETRGTFTPKDFDGYDDLKNFLTPSKISLGELIFTVAASFFSPAKQLTPETDLATITLSGLGQWVAVDLLGDTQESTAVAEVVPPRTTELALALVRMAAQSGTRPVDIGVDGTNRPVGYTHTLGLPSQARLQGATLRLLLVPNNPFFTTDYILLDEGVRRVAAGEEGAPVVALNQIHLSTPVGVGSRSTGVIDFSDVPLMLSPPMSGVIFPETPDTRRSLLGQLRDGRLNVIVTDDTTVIGSLLTVFLRDP